MPCSKCNADFNLLNWKQKCNECEDNYCSKCLRKIDGDTFCETCEILIKRPPVKTKLMELKSKDLQQYLNKHNISTRGVVEKQELVELLCKNSIPTRDKRRQRRFNCNLSGSVPNLAQRSQTYFSTLRASAEAAFNSRNIPAGGQSAQTTPVRTPPQTSPEGPPVNSFSTTSTTTTTFTTNTDGGGVFQTTSSSSSGGGDNGTSYTTTTTNSNNAGSSGTSHSTPFYSASAPSAPPVFTEQPPESSPQVPRKYPKLTDFQSLDDMNELSVKQLKELLSLNRVDYKGCVEKAELLERANRLWVDSNIRKEEVAKEPVANMDEACKICMDAPLDCVLLECGHMATCIECGKRLAECPICRQYVTRVVRTFKA